MKSLALTTVDWVFKKTIDYMVYLNQYSVILELHCIFFIQEEMFSIYMNYDLATHFNF